MICSGAFWTGKTRPADEATGAVPDHGPGSVSESSDVLAGAGDPALGRLSTERLSIISEANDFGIGNNIRKIIEVFHLERAKDQARHAEELLEHPITGSYHM
jgi:hypothetical protein